MPWGGGQYTRTNQTYNGEDVWQEDAANGQNIEADRHDLHDQDLADGVNDTLHRYGENSMGANLKMGGNKITDLLAATNANEAVRKDQMEQAIDAAIAPGTAVHAVPRWNGTKWEQDPVLRLQDGSLTGVVNIEASGTIDVTAAATFQSTIRVDGAATLKAALVVEGNTTLEGTLDVTGAITGTLVGNADGWTTPRKITVNGNATGEVTIDGTSNETLTLDVLDSLRANGWLVAVVGSLPGTPDANTLYFTTDTVTLGG